MSEHRAEAHSLALSDPDGIAPLLERFLRGCESLTALEFYYRLERVTPLLEFHTMLRTGSQNRSANGLQQSYGDHNRLLMLGLDKLVAGDAEWYRTRVDATGHVTDDELSSCLDRAATLDLRPEIALALWLAAALHDCGILCGGAPYVDVEDGVVLSRDLVEALCPAGMRDLTYFVLRHHDYIKDAHLGEVPVSLIADALDELDAALRSIAVAALGLVQVAGAASLGDGRLGAFRIAIFRSCLDGSALDDRSRLTRLSRLLHRGRPTTSQGRDVASALLDSLGPQDREKIERLLENTSVHGWHRAITERDAQEQVSLLLAIADAAHAEVEADHVVLVDDGEPPRRAVALSGARILALDCS